MRLVVSTKIPDTDSISVGLGGNPLYVNTSLFWHAEPLMGEYTSLLSGFERVTVPLLASIHPRDWRRLLFLANFTQEEAPGPGMLLPVCCLEVLPLAVASLAGEGKVAVWADPLDRNILYRIVVAGLQAGIGELWLVHVYSAPQLLGDLEVGDTPAAYYFLKRYFPRMTDRVSFRLEEKSLKFREHMAGYTLTTHRRDVDLLGEAFGPRARVAREILLDNLESGGSMLLKSVLDYLREDKLYLDVFNRLLDYGYLKLTGIPPQVAITEKGLYVLRE